MRFTHTNPPTAPYHNQLSRPANNILTSLDDTTHLIPGLVQSDGSIEPSTLKSVKITITSGCNYGCLHCGRDRDAKTVVIGLDRFRQIAEQVKALGIKKFGLFFDGNSTLAPRRLIECVQCLREVGISYPFLTDNGTSSTPKTVETLIRSGLGSFKWSMNANHEMFTELTSMQPNLLNLALRNIKAAWGIRERLYNESDGELDCSLSASSILFNEGTPAQMRPFLEEHVFPYVDTHYWLDEYTMGGEDAVTRMEGIGTAIRGNSGRHGEIRSAMPCWATINALHIAFGPDFDGENGSLYLYSCCFPTQQEGHVMADLSQVSLAEAINSPAFRALRLAHVNNRPEGTPCFGCVTGKYH
jgi:hypothetical protein